MIGGLLDTETTPWQRRPSQSFRVSRSVSLAVNSNCRASVRKAIHTAFAANVRPDVGVTPGSRVAANGTDVLGARRSALYTWRSAARRSRTGYIFAS